MHRYRRTTRGGRWSGSRLLTSVDRVAICVSNASQIFAPLVFLRPLRHIKWHLLHPCHCLRRPCSGGVLFGSASADRSACPACRPTSRLHRFRYLPPASGSHRGVEQLRRRARRCGGPSLAIAHACRPSLWHEEHEQWWEAARVPELVRSNRDSRSRLPDLQCKAWQSAWKNSGRAGSRGGRLLDSEIVLPVLD